MGFREFKASFLTARMVMIWVAASGTSILAGPFGTGDMPLIPRTAYWLSAIAVAMMLSGVIIRWSLETRYLARLSVIARCLFGAFGFSVIYSALLVGFGASFFTGDGFPGFWLMLGYVTPVCVAITVIVHLFRMAAPVDVAPPSAPAPFLSRLNPSLGNRLIRLSMQDHYVEVVTVKGSQLILMRFADALTELDGIVGWRIHRSHWVAEAGLAGLKREAGKTIIVTSDDAELPVSRTYLPALRDAGVIKRLS